MLPLWGIDFTDEVKNYFIDNGDYTGNLLGEIELLRYRQDGLPEQNYSEIEDHIVWGVLRHWVYYVKRDGTLLIVSVKPL
jgi:hypothetical protein